MRNTLSIIFAMLLIFSSCKKDNEDVNQEPDIPNQITPQQVQWGFALNYTASWWGFCGDWGNPLIHDYAAMGKVVAVATHADSDPMHNDLYDSFKNDRTTNNSIPAFWVGDVKTTDLDEMTTLLSQTPIAGIGITSSINGTTMTVNTQVKFFEDAEGEYYLSVLVLESGIDGSSSAGAYAQSGSSSSNYHHDFVLRASSVEGNAYGELILTDPVNGETADKDFEIPLNSSWNKTVYPVAILWKKDESSVPKYKYINAAS